MPPRAFGPKSEYTVTLSDGDHTIGIMTQSKTGIRRLPRGPGVERKAIKQSNWTGGRGNERFSTDTTRFFESTDLWSTVQGQVCNGPLRCIADTPSLNAHATSWPTGAYSITYPVTDKALTALLVPASNMSAVFLSFIARKIGNPNDLTVKIYQSSAGDPGTILTTVTLTASSVSDIETTYRGLTISPAISLLAGHTYWVSFMTVPTADGAWMLLGTAGRPYARLAAANTDLKRVKYFEYKRGLYALCVYRNRTTPAKILRNGDRGTPSNGAATNNAANLVDNTKSWVVNEWAGCVVLITAGVNKGEYRTIDHNTEKILYFATGDNWPTACAVASGAAGSEYVILGSNKWTEVKLSADGGTSIPISAGATDVAVFNRFIYIAQGTDNSDSAMYKLRESIQGGLWLVEGAADGSNRADYLCTSPHWSTGMPALWIARNYDTMVYAAEASIWSASLDFGGGMPCGETESNINSIIEYNNSIYCGKDDSIWQEKDGSFKKVPLGIDRARDERNGVSMIWWNTQIFSSLLGGLERLYGTTLDDIGPDRDQGMIAARRGNIVDMVNVANMLYCLYQSPNGNSSLLSTTDPGGDWHNLATINGLDTKASGIFYQTIPGHANRLWIGTRYNFWYCIMPDELHNPIRDENMRYAWESFLTTSWIDADSPELDHFFDEMIVSSKNLTDVWTTAPTRLIEIEYQLDDADYERDWVPFASTITHSPFERITVGDGNVTGRRIRFRFRLTCNCVTPAILNSFELRLNTMNEVLYDYLFDMKIADRMELMDGSDTLDKWSTMMGILESWKEAALPLTLRTPMPGTAGVIDNIRGHIDPVSLVTNEWDDAATNLSGQIIFKQT